MSPISSGIVAADILEPASPMVQRRAIAKAITLLESTREDHRTQADELLTALLPHTGKALRLGISGVPGVGSGRRPPCSPPAGFLSRCPASLCVCAFVSLFAEAIVSGTVCMRSGFAAGRGGGLR